MEQAVEQHRSVSRREYEAIAVDPARVGGIVLEETRPQNVRHRRGAHRQARMAAVCLLHRVYRKETQRIDARVVKIRGRIHGAPPSDFMVKATIARKADSQAEHCVKLKSV